MLELETKLTSVSKRYSGLNIAPRRFGAGLINDTFEGELEGQSVIVQRLHPAFAASVHHDIEAVTAHLEDKGLETPRLIRTANRELSCTLGDGSVWRVQTKILGTIAHDRLVDAPTVAEAGALVARFHGATSDLAYDYLHVRPGIHDLEVRRTELREAILHHPEHRFASAVAQAAATLETLFDRTLRGDLPRRHAHGDLKASNLLFGVDDRARCLVDFDTVGRLPWVYEMGDALRSWCNPHGEDDATAGCSLELFEAALSGYGSETRRPSLAPEEIQLLPRGLLTIASLLTLRFLTDTLRERYFSFDASRFESRGEHNLARARGQLRLACDVADKIKPLTGIAKRCLD